MMKYVCTVILVGFLSVFMGLFPFGKREVLAGDGKDYFNLANSLAQFLLSARLVISRSQDVIDTHGAKVGEPVPEGAPTSNKGLVPAVFGKLVSDELVLRTGIALKQTTLGKGGFGPRNIYNKPDEWERAILQKVGSRSYPRGVGFGEFVNVEEGQGLLYRFMLPVYVDKSCLKCHGDPEDSPTGDGLDVTGRPMEGYKEGEFIGGISVTIPVREILRASSDSWIYP